MNEWMNEWMCIYIPHISHTVSRRFTILIEWDRTSACKGASGCRYQSIFDLTHPPSPCMKCTMKQQIDHHTGNYAPYQVCLYVFLDLTLYSTWRKKYLRCYSLNQFRCISLNWRAPAFYNQLKKNSEYILNKKYVLKLDKDVFVMTRQRKQFGGPMRSQIWDLWIPCLNPLPLSHRYSSVSWAPPGFISLCDTRPTYCQDKLCQKRDISVRNKREIFQLGHKKEKF